MQPGLRTTDAEVSSLGVSTDEVLVGYTMGPNLILIRLQEAPQRVPVSQLSWRPLSSSLYPPTSPSNPS